jgi:hypothetical protein
MYENWQLLGCASRESWQYSRDYNTGYCVGRSDARACAYGYPAGVSEGYAAGYERGHRWTCDHPPVVSPVLAAIGA